MVVWTGARFLARLLRPSTATAAITAASTKTAAAHSTNRLQHHHHNFLAVGWERGWVRWVRRLGGCTPTVRLQREPAGARQAGARCCLGGGGGGGGSCCGCGWRASQSQERNSSFDWKRLSTTKGAQLNGRFQGPFAGGFDSWQQWSDAFSTATNWRIDKEIDRRLDGRIERRID